MDSSLLDRRLRDHELETSRMLNCFRLGVPGSADDSVRNLLR